MTQTWHDLLFAHWPIPPEALRRLVPSELALDTFNNNGWVGVAPFHMSRIRPRGICALPGLSRFPELNVRTYVTLGDKPGVYFFSLDAGNLAAVWGARTFYLLPYFHARMRVTNESDWIAYSCHRLSSGNQDNPAEFQGRYRPIAPVQFRQSGSLEHWLTERYCLYTADASRRTIRGEIHHRPWPLQLAEAEFTENTMARAAGMSLLNTPPLLHFAARQDVVVWPPKKIE